MKETMTGFANGAMNLMELSETFRANFEAEQKLLSEIVEMCMGEGLNYPLLWNIGGLIWKTGDLNVMDTHGENALTLAVFAYQNSLIKNSSLIEKLLAAGADPNRRSNALESPLVIASNSGLTKIVKLLLDHSEICLAFENQGNDAFQAAGRSAIANKVRDGVIRAMITEAMKKQNLKPPKVPKKAWENPNGKK